MERNRQRRIVEVDRGLFLVCYVAAEDEANPPSVKVSSGSADRNVSLVLDPDQRDAVLWQPGASLVVRTTAQSKLLIEVTPTQHDGSAAATVRMERLTQGEPSADPPSLKDPNGPFHYLDEMRLLGHVASIGDVVVKANEWLAGPSAPSRIEGISIEWPGKPEGIDICYSVQTARAQAISGRVADLGSFAGTRGKAMPIVGIMLEVSGIEAANLLFDVQAIFLGSPTVHIRGRRIELQGPTGREPLVGLRIGLEEVVATARSEPLTSGIRPGRTSSGVRVFRSRPKPGQSLTV